MVDYRKIIKMHRKKKHMTQVELAKAAGITPAYVYEIESGRKKPSIDSFFAICEVLDIKVFPDE